MASSIDSKVAALLDKHTDQKEIGSDDEDALFDELEKDESALDAFREKRLQQLHNEYVAFLRKYKHAHSEFFVSFKSHNTDECIYKTTIL